MCIYIHTNRHLTSKAVKVSPFGSVSHIPEEVRGQQADEELLTRTSSCTQKAWQEKKALSLQAVA